MGGKNTPDNKEKKIDSQKKGGPKPSVEKTPSVEKIPAKEIPAAKESVKADAGTQLAQLEDEIERSKQQDILKDLDSRHISYRSWLDMLDGYDRTRKETAIKQITDILPKTAGLNTLVDGLRAPKGTEKFENAKDCLERIIKSLDKKSQYLNESEEGLKNVKEDVAINSVTGLGKKILDNFNRSSGPNKLMALAAFGIVGYFLHKFWKESKTGKWVVGLTVGTLAVDIITGMTTGKSLFEHLGIGKAKESISREMRMLADRTNISDNPLKLKALAKLGDRDIDDCYPLWKESSGTIYPPSLNIYDGSLNGREIFDLMDNLVKKAGGPNAFREKFMGKRKYTFFETVMALYGREGAEMITEIQKPELRRKFSDDFGKMFGGEHSEYGANLCEKINYLYVLGAPVLFETQSETKDSYSYIFYVTPEKFVKIPVNQTPEARRESMARLKQYVQERILNALPTKFRKEKPQYINGQWTLRDISIDGAAPVDLVFKFDDKNPEKPFLRVLCNGQIVKDLVSPETEIGIGDLEKATYSLKISQKVQAFDGLEIKVDKVKDADDPAWKGWKFVSGRVDEFDFVMAVKGDVCELYKPNNVLQNEKFVEIKAQHAERELKPSITKLTSIIHEVPERLWRPTAIYKGLSGSIRENFWTVSAESKCGELVHIYKNKLRQAKDLRDAGKIWQETVGVYKAQMDNLYEDLRNDVKIDKTLSHEDFEQAFDKLDGIGYKSEKFKGIMKNLREELLKPDYEGLDKSDWMMLANEVYAEVRKAVNFYVSEFAALDPLNGNQEKYLSYLEGAVTDKLTEIRTKSSGLGWLGFKKTINRENLPISYNDWGIKEYSDWKRSNP